MLDLFAAPALRPWSATVSRVAAAFTATISAVASNLEFAFARLAPRLMSSARPVLTPHREHPGELALRRCCERRKAAEARSRQIVSLFSPDTLGLVNVPGSAATAGHPHQP